MQNIKVLSGQSLFDISIQSTGNVNNTYAIALINGKSLTDNLTIGELIMIPVGLEVAKRELKYLDNLDILPATGITINEESVLIPKLGIGTMVIGSTFIVG
jgi:hypothetical protein